MASRIVVHIVAVWVLAGLPATAQLTPQQAQKQLTQAAKAGLSDLKALHAAQLVTLQGGLDTFVAGVQAGTFGAPLVTALAQSIADFQSDGLHATELTRHDLAAAGTGLLTDLDDATPLNGLYPKGFQVGDGGAFDDGLAAIRKLELKTYTKARARIAHAAAAAQKAGIALAVELRMFSPRDVESPAVEGVIVGDGFDPLEIGMVLSAGTLAATGDGIVAVSGTGTGGADDTVDLSLIFQVGPSLGNFNASALPAADDLNNHFWFAIMDDEGGGLLPGNYALSVIEEPSGSGVSASVGVR